MKYRFKTHFSDSEACSWIQHCFQVTDISCTCSAFRLGPTLERDLVNYDPFRLKATICSEW